MREWQHGIWVHTHMITRSLSSWILWLAPWVSKLPFRADSTRDSLSVYWWCLEWCQPSPTSKHSISKMFLVMNIPVQSIFKDIFISLSPFTTGRLKDHAGAQRHHSPERWWVANQGFQACQAAAADLKRVQTKMGHHRRCFDLIKASSKSRREMWMPWALFWTLQKGSPTISTAIEVSLLAFKNDKAGTRSGGILFGEFSRMFRLPPTVDIKQFSLGMLGTELW